ncbi:MAG TPA: pantetheine-phosphate adenylyltransferase [Deltaproteobacteria bacterium]|nr:pantetheine-phosphate adenylyltransferase [Deltaproteobacteria bacterium]
MGQTAVYAGSFDPITRGHVDIVRRGATMFDRIVIAVGQNPSKRYTFDLAERIRIIRSALSGIDNIEVDCFDGLLVDYCRTVGANVILRGLRAVTDFEFEFKIGLANMDMAPDIQTVFLLTEPQMLFVSSSLVREIASHGGDIQRYVPEEAARALQARYAKKS